MIICSELGQAVTECVCGVSSVVFIVGGGVYCVALRGGYAGVYCCEVGVYCVCLVVSGFVCSVVLSMCRCRCSLLLYSAGSGENSVQVAIFVDMTASLLMCVDVMTMPSAYEVRYSGACGMSDVYMLKSVGERTPPCETPVLNWCCVCIVSLIMIKR